MGVAHAVLAESLAVEHGCRSEDQRLAPLDSVGIALEALRPEVAELPGIFLQGGIGGNQPIDLRQGDQSQVAVGRERLEQGELGFLFHKYKCEVVALGHFSVDTFRILGITDKEVIKNCYIGRSNYYKMKQGVIINADAYVRLFHYAEKKIREQVERHLLPIDFEGKWRERWFRMGD